MQILVLEDDPQLGKLACDALLAAGHRVELADMGAQALALLAFRPFDVLVCDWMLPDIDGTQVVRQLRAHLSRQPRVVMISGLGAAGRDHALRVGANAYLDKPFAMSALVDLVNDSAPEVRAAEPSTVIEVPAIPAIPAITTISSANVPTLPNLPNLPGGTLSSSVRPSRPAPSVSISHAPSSLSRSMRASASSRSSQSIPAVDSENTFFFEMGDSRQRPSLSVPDIGSPIEDTEAWRNALASARRVLCDAIGLELLVANGEPTNLDNLGRCFQRMVDVGHGIEIGVALFSSANSGVELARRLLREMRTDGETLREMLMEMCNAVLGHIKHGLRKEGYGFSVGLAERGMQLVPRDLPRLFDHCQTMRLRGGGLDLLFFVGIRTTTSQIITAEKLRENMILVDDLHNDAGQLMLPAGTRLTSSTAARIAEHLKRRPIRVFAPEAAA